VRQPEEVHFLGFRFRCQKNGDEVAVLLSGKAKERLKATIREMTPPNWGRSITMCMEEISRYLIGWMSHYRLCTPEALQDMGKIDAHARRRIRAIIIRQKKRQRFLFRHLRAKGVSVKAAAGCAYCGKGAWVKSNRPAMTRAYSPFWFNGRMKSLKALWQGLHTPSVSDQLVLGL
jgi:RNA-directed DNA polymerase